MWDDGRSISPAQPRRPPDHRDRRSL